MPVIDTRPSHVFIWSMSKQRPSKSHVASGLPTPLSTPLKPAPQWLRRIFHSTYTRRGRRIPVRGWSVKIQSQGRRRTFALAAGTRVGAAAEAKAIYEHISAGGWDTVVQKYSGGHRGRSFPKTDARWWRERLLLRNYPLPTDPLCERQFSTRIEHAGIGCYFPLGTSDPEAASTRALEIYLKVIQEGWNAAWGTFAREVTLSFHWACDPLLWTYTTVHTLSPAPNPNPTLTPNRPHSNSGNTRNRTCILLVESDQGIRRALSRCIDQHEACSCVACPTPNAVRRQNAAGKTALCLVNRDLAGGMGLSNSDQVGTLPEGTPAVSYAVHRDSEELFALTPGGASGYVLKRTSPRLILEPVLGALSRGPVEVERLLRSSQGYFRRVLQSGPVRKPSGEVAQLTRREQDVLNLVSKGSVDKEIAQALGISTWTVHEHVKRIFEKLHVHSRTELVLACLQK